MIDQGRCQILKRKLFLYLVSAALLLAACSRQEVTATPRPAATRQPGRVDTPVPTAYPGMVAEQPYPYPGGYPGAPFVYNPYPGGYPAASYPEPGYPPAVVTAAPTAVEYLPAVQQGGLEPSQTPQAAYPIDDQGATPFSVTPDFTATSAPPTVTPTITLTPTPTAHPGSPSLVASDPARLQLISGRVQLIEFFAFWDGNSRAMAPVLHGLESVYNQRVNFIYLDIDDPANNSIKKQLGYRYQPQYFLIDPRGGLVWQGSGFLPANVLEAAILSALE